MFMYLCILPSFTRLCQTLLFFFFSLFRDFFHFQDQFTANIIIHWRKSREQSKLLAMIFHLLTWYSIGVYKQFHDRYNHNTNLKSMSPSPSMSMKLMRASTWEDTNGILACWNRIRWNMLLIHTCGNHEWTIWRSSVNIPSVLSFNIFVR